MMYLEFTHSNPETAEHTHTKENSDRETSLPNRLVLFSARGEKDLKNLASWFDQHNYLVAVFSKFQDMCRHLDQNTCIAVLIDTHSNGDAFPCSEQQLAQLMARWPHLRLIALTSRNLSKQSKLGNLIRQGLIYDFHTLPVDRTRLLYCLGHIQGLVSLEKNTCPPSLHNRNGFGHLLGVSEVMKRVYHTINRVSQVNTPVLITGESGTGKELVARTIHDHSPFREGEFVAINCAALPVSLIESELFGHEIGAFTGALRRKTGKVELADNGTLFLDEIGDMPADLQTRFLRFLQNSTFERVGGLKSHNINTRIIAATNVNLQEAIQNGRFRKDLYYRLNVISIILPALRKREEDIRLLAETYLEKFKTRYGKPRLMFSQASYELMNKYPWPGNVRELISAVRRATILTRGRLIHPEDLALHFSLREARETSIPLTQARADFDRRFIRTTLIRNCFNVSKAAEDLSISRAALYRLIKRLGLDFTKMKGEHTNV
tara:strand:- start:8652 stop:10127 length:1476 start_codon:yes stop_codon:yes gene_type:complete